MYILVCYDIVTNSRRTKLMKTLKSYLERVQKSVFEGEITAARCQTLQNRIGSIIDHEIDTVRIYFLCKGCRHRIEIIGTGAIPDPEGDWVV